MRDITYIGTNFYIKPTYMVAIPEFTGSRKGRSKLQVKAEKNLLKNSTKGILSAKSGKKLLNAVNWLVKSAKSKNLYSKKHNKFFSFKINFITLTFPYEQNNPISERVAKQCLHTFLSYSRKYFYLRNYVWKMEKTKAGQLHIHLTTDTYINYRSLRKSWNGILINEGLMRAFQQKWGHTNPNSSDVHAVHKVKDVAAYIAKYMSKSATEMPEYKGRIWSCNREISHVNKCTQTIYANQEDISSRVLYRHDVEWKPINTLPDAIGRIRKIGEIFFMNDALWQRLQNSVLKEAYDTHRRHIRDNTAKLPDKYWEENINEFFDSLTRDKPKPLLNDPKNQGLRSVHKTIRANPARQAEINFA